MERGRYKKVPVDIDEVMIDTGIPKKQRMASYLKQVKNPYKVKVNGTVVEMEYSDNGHTLQELVEIVIGIDM